MNLWTYNRDLMLRLAPVFATVSGEQNNALCARQPIVSFGLGGKENRIDSRVAGNEYRACVFAFLQ